MLNIRKGALSEGWYPSSDREIQELLSTWKDEKPSFGSGGSTIAGIVPHAGWTFCGSIIADVLLSLQEDLETIVILGGHNPPGGPLIGYYEDAWELPSRMLQRDAELSGQVEMMLPEGFTLLSENSVDNTVEVIIPLAAAMYPDVKWAAWRLPADERAIIFGEKLAEAVMKTGRRTAVIGSTDLTHYGPNYGFSPTDSLDSPSEWMERRDRKILRAFANFEGRRALELAVSEKSACSAGAAAGAMAFAESCGTAAGKILSYSTSRDIYPSSSFVGYGSIIWEPG